MENNFFSSFTNQYALSKTLRFELKPVGKTSEMLQEANVFGKDEIIQKKYRATKPYFDRLHREFVAAALKEVNLSGLEEYRDILVNLQKDKKNKEIQKVYEEKAQELRKEIVRYFNTKAKEWVEDEKYAGLGLKNKDIEILFEEAVFELLKEKYGKEDDSFLTDDDGNFVLDKNGKKISIFDSWKGFTGYFTKFFATRKNFYKDDGTSTALATRIIDQNLKRFCDNFMLFEKIREKIKVNSREVEENFGVSLPDIFSLKFYNKCLLQEGIDFYNAYLGADSKDQTKRGLNQIINEYNQNNKGEKIGFFKSLDKQILSEKKSFLEGIENEEQFLDTLKKFVQTAEEKTVILKKLFADFSNNTEGYDLSQIYLSKEAFNTISHRWTGETETFEKWLFESMKSEKLAKYEKQDNSYKFPDFIALSYLKNGLKNGVFEGYFWKDKYYEIAEFEKKNKWEQFLMIFSLEFDSLFMRTVKDDKGIEKQIGYEIFSKNFKELLSEKPFHLSQEAKITIKEFADSVLNIYQMAKYFAVEKKKAWLTEYELDSFYTNPDTGYYEKFYKNSYTDIVEVYNDIRNYLTKKPYSEEKWKLNFECSYLLGGWASEFGTYSTLLFEKNGNYYLGIINGASLSKEKRAKLTEGITNENSCKKMVYDFQKPDNKNVPRLFIRSKGENFAPAVKELNLPIESILEIYDQGLFKTENKNHPLFRQSLEKLIDYFKIGFSKHASYKHFPFKWRNSTEYKNIAEFYQDTIRSCYQIQWEVLNFDEIKRLTETNDLYLFQIYNKDFSNKSNGIKNLHSLYFQALFLYQNLENDKGVIFKLSGGGEIFFRPKTDVKKLGERKDSKGKIVVKNKRYSQDKMFLHFPIELNYARSQGGSFNSYLNTFLANNPDINIIGVDRGEKHLAYYSGINQKSEILQDKDGKPVSGSLNFVGKDTSGNPINYHQKLEEKAKNREQARKDWQAVEGIKDLKKGYISQVVRKLADLAIEHNAIIIFEDLNMRFKQIRGGIEKSVYQQLEKALIEKLNFLVKKGETDPTKAGHLLKAYQLTAPFETFKDMGKQTGILFYTQASYTSKIDPVTGWRPHLYLKYSSAEKAKADITKFSKIEFTNERFEFTYDIKQFQLSNKEQPKKQIWTVCSSVERFRWDKSLNQNKGGYTHYTNLTDGKAENKNLKSTKPDNITELFVKYGINIEKNIKEQIQLLEVKGNEKFFEHFIFFFNLICQIRNTDEKALDTNKQDFILSPVEPFFDSRTPEKFGKNLPQNGDDNGAYNIARKGILILEKLAKHSKEDPEFKKYPELYISNTEWDDFAAKKS